jgi:hypothetical protein
VEPVAIVTRLIFFCSALPAHIGRPMPHRPSQFSRPAFFCRSFFWALLQANSSVLQLRVFCFPGSALTPLGSPPIKQPLALEAAALAFGCPRKMGQKKETFSCPTYMLSGIALRCGPIADVSDIRAWFVLRPLPYSNSENSARRSSPMTVAH